MSGVYCPFCGEDDFDQIGLKFHLSYGCCEAYNNTKDCHTEMYRVIEIKEALKRYPGLLPPTSS